MKLSYNLLTYLCAILLVIWGAYTTLIFLGVPAHFSVLSLQSMYQGISNGCTQTADVCRGMHTLLPMLQTFIVRMQPLLPYMAISGLAWLALLGWSTFISGQVALRFTMRPWHLASLFIVAILLFQVSIAAQAPNETNNLPYLTVIDASEKVFPTAPKELLTAMRDNVTALERANCLTPAGTAGDATIYKIGFHCVYSAFFSRTFTQIICIFIFLLFVSSIGRFGFLQLKLPPVEKGTELLCSVVIGICMFIVALWALALVHAFAMPFLWALLVLGFALAYKHVLYWARQFTHYSWEVQTPWYCLSWVFAWLLLSLLAFNFLTVVRPFPIGWDDLGVYLNEPRLLTSYGFMTPFFAVFRWEYITALGFGLFGYESVFGATFAMLLNWSAGLLAVGAIILLTRRFLPMRASILAGLLYYMLPIVGHFSFADMKTDNAVFMFQFAAIAATLFYLFPRTDEEAKSSGYGWLIFAGVCTAIGFATKPTTAMAFFASIALLVSGFTNAIGFIAVCIATFTFFALYGTLNTVEVFAKIGFDVSKYTIVFIGLLSTAIFGMAALLKKQKNILPMAQAIGMYIGAFILCIIPWLVLTNIANGNTVPALLFNTPAFNKVVTYDDLPANLAIDPNHELCKSTGGVEELDRYWGNHAGIFQYMLLPWRSVMNTDIHGYYVTSYAALLLVPLLLFAPLFWKPENKWLRWLAAATIFMLVQWIFLANGVVWYGIGMFAGLVIMLAAFTTSSSLLISYTATFFIVLSIITAFGMRMWQFDLQKNMYDYQVGKASATVMAERTIPHYNNVRDEIAHLRATRPNNQFVYRIGTFIPYFIPRNFEVFGRIDHQLDFFNCLHQERDNQKTLQRIKALGFNSFIFDTNTATIEKDPNGSLHKKVAAFTSWVRDPSLGMTSFINDPQAGIAYFIIPE